MKKIAICLLLLFFSIAMLAQRPVVPLGEYVTIQTEETEVFGVKYTFTKDSLYIDVYPSGCGLTSYKLKRYNKTKQWDYVAIETGKHPYTKKTVCLKHYVKATKIGRSGTKWKIKWRCAKYNGKTNEFEETIERLK